VDNFRYKKPNAPLNRNAGTAVGNVPWRLINFANIILVENYNGHEVRTSASRQTLAEITENRTIKKNHN
jgi:hypothetical protein